MKTIGYIQQTSDAADLQHRISDLNAHGIPCQDILIESDVHEAISMLGEGDRIVVCRLSEMGDSLSQVFGAIDAILERKSTICSLSDDWVNTGSSAEGFPYVIKALNALNKEIISKQTKRGLKKALRKGRKLGRPTVKSENN